MALDGRTTILQLIYVTWSQVAPVVGSDMNREIYFFDTELPVCTSGQFVMRMRICESPK